jgi:hypothetical protein
MLRRGSVFNKHILRKLSDSVKSAVVASTATSRREMCGLVAAIDDVWTPRTSFRGEIPILDDREALRRTTRILDHRGPDGTKLVREPLVETPIPSNTPVGPWDTLDWLSSIRPIDSQTCRLI